MSIRFCLPLMLLLNITHSAFSQLILENRTTDKVYVAFGYSKSGAWLSDGYWAVEPGGKTEVAFRNFATGRYLYLFAEAGALKWGGDYQFLITRSERFNALKDSETYSESKYRRVGFYQIDTEMAETLKVYIQPDGKIKVKVDCQAVSELTKVTAPLLEKFVNVALPSFILRKTDIDCGNNAKLQFEIHRNGPVRVKAGSSGQKFGSMTISVPIRVLDARVDWYEKVLFSTVRHHEDIEGTALTLHSTVDYKMDHTGRMETILTNNFTWDQKPSVTIFGVHISIGGLCEPHINEILHGMNNHWYAGAQPALQAFVSGNCKWRNAALEASEVLQGLEVSSRDAAWLQQQVKQLIDKELNK